MDIAIPPSTPSGEVWRYGLGFPIQVAPRLAGLFCNIRKVGTSSIDFEIGSDIILFDDLDDIQAEKAIPLSRYENEVRPGIGNTVTKKGPVVGGFVPIGAKLEDGSPHPHAGTGFGMCWAIVHPVDQNDHYEYSNSIERYDELLQFAYDGRDFKVLKKERVNTDTLLSDWMLC